MESMDAEMTNDTEHFPIPVQNIDTLKLILEQSLKDINNSLSQGIHDIKAELSSQVQTILISIPKQSPQGINRFGSLLGFRSSTDPTVSESLSGGDADPWKAQCEYLEREKEQMNRDNDKLRTEQDQRYRALEVRMGNMTQISANTEELQLRLASTNQQNSELREQVSKFREIILKKTNNQVQTTPDSTLINSFADLRVRIQHIVFKFYRFEQNHYLKLKGATSRQHDFFGNWGRGFTDAQLKRRARAKIFELLSDGILCKPIFGLDDHDKTGDLELMLSRFESALNSKARGSGEISEWRSQTVKCARLLDSPKSRRPSRIMADIMDFMEPISPEKKTEKYVGLKEALLELCTSAFKLSLQLRECKDLYRCETPRPGDPFIEDDADEQDSESGSAPELPATRVAFAMSGALVKYPENQTGSRIILEKAHVVTCD